MLPYSNSRMIKYFSLLKNKVSFSIAAEMKLLQWTINQEKKKLMQT